MPKIITFGEIMLRLSPHGYQRLFQNDQMEATFGGGEANVAVSLCNYGDEAVFVTKLPSNAIGQAAIDCLRSFGVDVSYIVRGGDRVGIYYLEKGASQRGSVCLYDRAHSSIQEAISKEFDWDTIMDGADWFHFTGITPALGNNMLDACLKACEAAHRAGAKVSCDINYRSKLWSRDEARDAMTRLCHHVDVYIGNEEDAKDVFGIIADDSDITMGKLSKDGLLPNWFNSLALKRLHLLFAVLHRPATMNGPVSCLTVRGVISLKSIICTLWIVWAAVILLRQA